MSDSEKPKSWKERRQSIEHKWKAPFIFFFEWPCEWISYWLGKWAFLKILEYAGRLTVLIAVIFYIQGCPERQRQAENQRKAKQYQAWQVINTAYGKPGGGGRKDALEDLNKDGISLAGVDISRAHLPNLNLENAELWDANLAEAYLWRANLSEASLNGANLAGAYLNDANLVGAYLFKTKLTEAEFFDANLTGAYLDDANLTKAKLQKANLVGAKLTSANLTGANLREANLYGADLTGANLAGADLYRANLTEAELMNVNLDGAFLFKADLINIKNWRKIKNIKNANIFGVGKPPEGFKEWALKNGAIIEDVLGWRDMIR